MALSTIWRLQGVDTMGADLTLTELRLWGSGGAVDAGASVSSSHPPAEGTLANLVDGDFGTYCRFAAADVVQPGFWVQFELPEAREAWGFRFAGPNADHWPNTHSIAIGSGAANTLGRAAFEPGGLSPAPTKKLSFAGTYNTWDIQSGPGSRDWQHCATSADGETLLAAANSGTMWLTKDRGATWVPQTSLGTKTWSSCAVSSNGQVLVAAARGAGIWVSNDGGASWTTTIGAASWFSCGVSANGQVILASIYNGGNLRLSKDGGNSWVEQTAPGSRLWRNVAVSGDGLTLLAAANNDSLWLSKNGGSTWSAVSAAGVRLWFCGALSYDGLVIAAGVYSPSSGVWLSKDGGDTWSLQTPLAAASWVSLSLSWDGQVLLAAPYSSSGTPMLSLDGGTRWVAQANAGSRNWYGCSVSGDGESYMLTANNPGPILTYFRSDGIYQPPRLAIKPTVAKAALQGTPPGDQGVFLTRVAGVAVVSDTEFGGDGAIYGTVAIKADPTNALVARRVRLRRSRDGLHVRETWSDAQGVYRFEGINRQYEYDVEAWDHTGNMRSVLANNVTPEKMA